MKNDKLDKRMSLARDYTKISSEKLLMGSTKGKYPVVLDDGKTIVYISDESKEAETRLKYESHKNSKFPSRATKYNS
jgi:hypothetical protein